MHSILNKSMLALTIVIAVVQMVYWYDKLPDIIPSHFDSHGEVDETMSKPVFFGMFTGIHAMFLVVFPLLGICLHRLPDSLINCPNKEYWLAPERRDETMGFNREYLIAIGWLSGWLMIGCIQLTAWVALEKRSSLAPEFYWMMGAYLLIVGASVVYTLLRFRLPADAAPKLTDEANANL